MTAWALVAAGVAAPAVRRRLRLPAPVALAAAAVTPAAVCVAIPPPRLRSDRRAPLRSHRRTAAVVALNMWAYLAAYEMPNDDPERLAARVRVQYPITIDRAIGLGATPTLRLQRAFATPGAVNRFERVLVWCHWLWFVVPHASLLYILLRAPERVADSATQMYAVFDLGAVFYWAIPTAPPWWAAKHGHLRDEEARAIRRMMLEYGEEFWGERWSGLYDVLGGNPLAAMPSLHFATSLMAAHLLSDVGPVAGAVGWSYALMLGLALVYLGEHYAIDLAAGAALTETVRAHAPALTAALRRFGTALDRLQPGAAVA